MARKPPHAEHTLRAAFERCVAGERVPDVAAELDRSDAGLRKAFKGRGWSVRGEQRKRREETLRAIFVRFRAGERLADVAAEHGLARSTCLAQFAKRGWWRWPPVSARTVRELWQRRIKGERTEALAAEHYRSASWLKKRWYELGLRPNDIKHHNAAQHRRDALYRAAWGMRCDGYSWQECVTALGYTGGTKSLYDCVRRWRKRHNIASPEEGE